MDLLASSCTNECQCYYTLESTSGSSGVECFQPPLGLSGELCVYSSNFSSPGSFPFPGRICHQSIQTSYSCGILLDGDSLASHSSQYIGRVSLSVSHCKGPCHGCLSWPGVQGSVITAFNPFATQRYVLCRQGFSSSLCQVVAKATQHL